MKPFIFVFFLFLSTLASKERNFVISSPKEDKTDVLVLGTAIADYFAFISEEELLAMELEKGGWKLISEKEWNHFEGKKSLSALRLGGSAMNVAKCLASLGVSCGCLGKIGSDAAADIYLQKVKDLHMHALLQKSPIPTAKALCFITPDGQKTMRTYIEKAHRLNDFPFSPQDFTHVRLFHIEGYQIVEKELLKKMCTEAKKTGALISMDLGNFSLVEAHKKDFEEFLKGYIDIVFANDAEAKALTGLEPMFACRRLSELCSIAVVTMGGKGGWVKRKKEQYYFPAIPCEVKDTTGAGDFFTGGFLLGLLQEKSLRECAWLGAFLASHAVREIGTDLSEKSWEEIKCCVQEMESIAKKEQPLSETVTR